MLTEWLDGKTDFIKIFNNLKFQKQKMRYSVDKYSVNMWQGTINNSFRKDYCVILFMSKFCLVGLLITSKTPLKQQWWFFHPWHFQQMLTLKQIDIGLVHSAGGKWNSHIGIGKWIWGERWLLFPLTSIFSSYSKSFYCHFWTSTVQVKTLFCIPLSTIFQLYLVSQFYW